MSLLILKRGKFSRSSGHWQDEDYDVFADGKLVGRILESGSRFDPPDLLWTWSITSIWPATYAPKLHAVAMQASPLEKGQEIADADPRQVMLASSCHATWICGRTNAESRLTSPVRANQPTMPSSSRSMANSGRNA
jgi:hypothetical protein